MVRRVYGPIACHSKRWTQCSTHLPSPGSSAAPPTSVQHTSTAISAVSDTYRGLRPPFSLPSAQLLSSISIQSAKKFNSKPKLRTFSAAALPAAAVASAAIMPSEHTNGTGSKKDKKSSSVAIAEYHLPRQVDSCSSFDGLSVSRPFIIGVAGGTASGKTSVCNKIIEELQLLELEHQGILSLSQDCFYRNLTTEERADIASFNFDHPSAFDFDEIVSTLARLKSGQPVEIPIYDFVTSARLPERTIVPQADAILFDGILAFYHPTLRDLFDLKIFVDTDADTRLARRIRRDIVERGRDVLQVLNQYERTVKPGFESHVRPTKKYADIIVPRGGDNTVAIDLILQHIRMKMMMKHVTHGSPNGFAS